MTDDSLRQLIREAVARHTGQRPAAAQSRESSSSPVPSAVAGRALAAAPTGPSLAFSLYVVPRPAGETDCVIEPGTRCDHCGYCLSHGH